MIIVCAVLLVFVTFFVIKKIYKKYWQFKLFVDIFLPEKQIFEGDIAKISEIIANDKFLPIPALETRFELDCSLHYVGDTKNSSISDKSYRRDVFSLGIKQKIVRNFDITCSKRGYFTISDLDLISFDIFLQQKFVSKTKISKSFYVLPKKVSNQQISLPYSQILGEISRRKTIFDDPFSFSTIREYTHFDAINSINWKASAKSQNLMVNTYNSAVKQKVYVILDTFDNENLRKSNLNEESIRICSSLVERLLHSNTDIKFITNSCDICTKLPINISSFDNVSATVFKQNLSKIELGIEGDIRAILTNVSKGDFVVFISKNTDLSDEISMVFKDFFWIIPYEVKPNINLPRNKCFLWEITN